MYSYQLTIFFLISATFVSVNSLFDDGSSNDLQQTHSTVNTSTGDLHLTLEKVLHLRNTEKVKIQLYYETMCPFSRDFIVQYFTPTVKKLHNYLDIHVYPYGNAETITNEEGEVEISCQHGQAECYGNMLHACAFDIISNLTEAIYFNSCTMEDEQDDEGSDDAAADKCGAQMNIDAEPIKSCAKGSRGFELLKSYGEESKKAHFRGVPYVLINGRRNRGRRVHFHRNVCAAMTNPPEKCNEI